jgi:FdhD protein
MIPTTPVVEVVKNDGAAPASYISLAGDQTTHIDGEIVVESLTCISVNGKEVATFMCSPVDLDKMALGFIFNEGFIDGLQDVHHLHISREESCVDIWLHDMSFEAPERQIVTAGCGGGVTFDDLSERYEPLAASPPVSAAQLAKLMIEMHKGAHLYQRARGIHTAVMADESGLLLQVEDVGRHNCLDKLAGGALQAGIDTRGKIILSSGRISSEMLNKARRMQVPIVCSRTSPTSLSVTLAEAWNITIVAYLRQNRMRLYTHPERILY